MIDFTNKAIFKLKPTEITEFSNMVSPLFIDGENIIASFRSMRDGIVFTNFRIIAINIQGISGKKKDFSSLPYTKIQAYSVETAGTFDLDAELELWFSGLGKVKFEFTSGSNILYLTKVISGYILK